MYVSMLCIFVSISISSVHIHIVLQVADLMFFILLCAVFLLAYGVAAQSLLYPNAEPRWEILYKVVYHPYFSMYQEFPLEELEGILRSQLHNHSTSSQFSFIELTTFLGSENFHVSVWTAQMQPGWPVRYPVPLLFLQKKLWQIWIVITIPAVLYIRDALQNITWKVGHANEITKFKLFYINQNNLFLKDVNSVLR